MVEPAVPADYAGRAAERNAAGDGQLRATVVVAGVARFRPFLAETGVSVEDGGAGFGEGEVEGDRAVCAVCAGVEGVNAGDAFDGLPVFQPDFSLFQQHQPIQFSSQR